jgi:serine/threonine protein kinase/Flp pilus assembly protein TadD
MRAIVEGPLPVPDQAAVPDSLIGLEFDHYRILERVGSGGMGVVYRGYDAHLEREVAIKVLSPGTIADDRARKRFRNEARALSKLNHPNIATVFDFHSQDGRDFLVMEFIEGITLNQKLSGGSLSEKDVIIVGTQLADGLAAAHEQGVIHLDLKPGNLRLTTDGRLKILDFGLAKLRMPSKEPLASETATETQVIAGTLGYMAPEQVLGDEIDARTDIHAAGLVLYQAATGLAPFAATTRVELVNEVLRSSPPSPNTFNAKLSLEVVRIIGKCLERDPNNRYQSAKELVIDLRRLQSGAPSGLPLPTRTSPRWFAKAVGLGALVAGFAVALLLLFNVHNWRGRIVGKANVPHIESLAVLPLINLSGDPQQEYFADGMSEELINNLGKIATLRVISRTSVMQYKQSKKNLPTIATELGVDAVIEGSVLLSNNRVRITAQLIEAKSDRHLWSNSYERNASDVLDLQAEVAQAIATQIQAQLTPQEHRLITSARLVNPAAQEAYLLGRYHWNRTTEDEWKQARQYFEKAVALDPTYAPPYAGLADYYAIDYELPTRTAFEKAKSYAERALTLDGTLAEAHLSLGDIRYNQWDWGGAEQEFKRTLELNPSHAEAHRIYAIYLSAVGREQEALGEIHTAQQLDPLSALVSATAGWVAYFARQYDRAIDQCKKTQKIDPNYVSAYDCLGSSYLAKGMYDQAIATCQAAMTLSGGDPDRFVCLGQAYAAARETAKARQLLKELYDISHQRHVPPYFFAVLHSAFRENAEAFAWLEKGYEQRDPFLVWIKVSPAADGLRSDTRLTDLIRRLGLSP